MRREVEHAKAAADLQESYAATCRKMGIEVCPIIIVYFVIPLSDVVQVRFY